VAAIWRGRNLAWPQSGVAAVWRGSSLAWPREIDFCTDALWFAAHPEDAARKHILKQAR